MPRLSSLFAIKCANRTHSRVVPGYKLECEGRACTNNKMAAELQPYTPSSLSGVPTKPPPPPLSFPNLLQCPPNCQQTYVPRRQPAPRTEGLFCRSAYLVNSFRMSGRLKYWPA